MEVFFSTKEMCDREPEPRRWYALVVLLIPTLLISLNNYMIQVALPLIQKSVHASFSQAQLIFSGYSLGLAVALIIGGKLGDLYGRKRMLLIGLSCFTLLAAAGSMSEQPALLAAIRIAQGMAAALIQPQVLSIMQNTFPPREKGLVFAIYGALIGIGFTLGLVLGGLVLDWNLFGLGWRSVLLFHVPFGLVVLMLLPIVPESRGQQQPSIDWTGALLLFLGLLLLVYPLTVGHLQGWPLWTAACMAAAVLLLASFLVLQRRKEGRGDSVLINLSLFRSRTLRTGMATVLVVYLSMFSFFFVLNYYLQFGLHETAQRTVLAFLPLGCGFFLSSLLSARLVRRWGIAVLKAGTLLMAAASFLLLTALYGGVVHLLSVPSVAIMLVYGFGLGMATTPLANLVLAAVPATHAGTGSGLFATVMYIANAIGVALISILFSASLGHGLAEAGLSDYVRAFSATVTAGGIVALLGFLLLCFV